VTIESIKTNRKIKKYFLKLEYEARLEREKEMKGEIITVTVSFFQRKNCPFVKQYRIQWYLRYRNVWLWYPCAF
jgi:hypothetical protein